MLARLNVSDVSRPALNVFATPTTKYLESAAAIFNRGKFTATKSPNCSRGLPNDVMTTSSCPVDQLVIIQLPTAVAAASDCNQGLDTVTDIAPRLFTPRIPLDDN